MKKTIAIIGIGYVGLHNAVSISKAGLNVIAYDKEEQRINDLSKGIDKNGEVTDFLNANLVFTSDPHKLLEANYYLISIPTPINERKVPNTFPLKSASKIVATALKKGDVVVLESTVFPGATSEILIPILEQDSGLESGKDFFVGYSSERIVPGDETNNLMNTTKVISGQNKEALDKIKQLYEHDFGWKIHCAPSVEVAESSKLLENIQRDVNIALMNEFAQIMEKMHLSINDVLEASKTKWNFLPFTPGLVGGHCIPEDPYYLIYQANKAGGIHNLITCARQTNEQFFRFIVDVVVKLLTKQDLALRNAKVAVLGISFKANVTDTRHSLSVALYHSLKTIGINAIACDPLSDGTVKDLHWVDLSQLNDCAAIILCQAHNEFKEMGAASFSKKIISKGVFLDIPGVFSGTAGFRDDIAYWSL